MKTQRIYNENCLDTMSRMSDNFIDLTITSPPYDDLRDYNGYSFDFKSIAKELFRVTKEGGAVVWIVGDATIKGSETGTSFKQALFFMECGFKLHDTMIWNKGNFTAVGSLKTRYAPVFEYMFVLTKGKIKTFNPIKDRLNKSANRKRSGGVRQIDGSVKKLSNYDKPIQKLGQRHNVWLQYPEMSNNNRLHPAPYPEQLAKDHIISWSNEGDLIYDCFIGSGTTAVASLNNNRNYIGSETSRDYCEIAEKRIEQHKVQQGK